MCLSVTTFQFADDTPGTGSLNAGQRQAMSHSQTQCAFGYAGVVVKATRKQLSALLRLGLRSKQLAFPARNGAVQGRQIQLIKKTA